MFPRLAPLLPLFGLALALNAEGAAARHYFEDSIKPVPADAPPSAPHRVREVLTPAESAQPLDIMVSLRMRNLPELQSIVDSGRIVSAAEMEARYLPSKSDYDRMAAWLKAQGLEQGVIDARHTNVFVRGTVAGISAALQVSFARVATADGEFTSAVTPPALPEEMASAVVGISGLQPHIRRHSQKLRTNALSPQTAHPNWVVPADILAAYKVPANLNGAGQTIGIMGFANPIASDLSTFGQLTGTAINSSNMTVVPISGGPGTQETDLFDEVSVDTQWASGIAPAANIRVYVAPNNFVDVFVACETILNEGIDTVFSLSIGTAEQEFPAGTLQSAAQFFVQMAAAGITVVASTGDDGAYGIESGSMPLYPATDPNVTAIGGSVMTLDSNWNDTGETAWNMSGGGYSTVFPRPTWQVGPGVTVHGNRCLPDTAAPANFLPSGGNAGAFLITNGFALTGFVGTSLSTPVWGGLVAIINQARANAGLPSLGPLAPKIYPLIGTSAFNSIPVGNNGYPAGPNYDLSTGVGTPNVSALIQVFAAAPPSISIQPTSQQVTPGGTVVFAVTAVSSAAITYQWQLNGTPIAGATGSRLLLSGGNVVAGSYTCVVGNVNGSVTSASATLTTAPTTNPGRLVNLSMLSNINGSLSMGFVIGGAGTSGNESLLIRAVGPSIGPGTLFNVGGIMPDPTLTVVQQTNNAVSFANAGWAATSTNQTAVTNADNATGAFGLTVTTSKDSALVESLPSVGGGYSATVKGASGDGGNALTEVYDVTSNYTAASTRLLNLSCLTNIPAGTTIDVGFVIGGATAKTLFIRASGPTLAVAPFNIGGAMADPQVTVLPSAPGSAVVSANAGWGGDATLSTVAANVGAFAFASPSSLDSATVVTLEPNVPYAVQVNSASGGGGEVLVEIYEVP